MKRIAYITLLILATMATVACHRRPLHDMEERITLKVTVDVDTVCNIGRYIYNDKIEKPNTNTDMLRVFLYDPTNGKQLAQTFLSDKSYDAAGHQVFTGYMNIIRGTFNFLVYNFDTPNTLIREENNQGDIQAYTQQLSAQESALVGADSGTVSFQPDHLMVAREQSVYIKPHTEMETVETTAYTCINTYYIQIHVIGLQYVRVADAVITGLYSANNIGLDPVSPWTVGQRVSNPSTSVYFRMEKSTDDKIEGKNKDVLCALFNTFGKIEEMSSDLKVTFNLIDTEGNRLQKTVSLNEVFRTENARERHWLLLDDVWEIEDPVPHPVSGGGFLPVVGDWEEEYGEIEL